MMKIENADKSSSAGTTAEQSTKADVQHVCQPIAKPDVMRRLSELGWQNRCDTFDTYYKKINNYEIVVSKHIKETKWQVTLVLHDGGFEDEITINEDAKLEWIISITELLSNGA